MKNGKSCHDIIVKAFLHHHSLFVMIVFCWIAHVHTTILLSVWEKFLHISDLGKNFDIKNFSKIFTNINRLAQVKKPKFKCLKKSLCSVQIRETTDQKKLRIRTLSIHNFVFYWPNSKESIMIFYNSLTFSLISRVDNAILQIKFLTC